jgi:hypothetical protein
VISFRTACLIWNVAYYFRSYNFALEKYSSLTVLNTGCTSFSCGFTVLSQNMSINKQNFGRTSSHNLPQALTIKCMVCTLRYAGLSISATLVSVNAQWGPLIHFQPNVATSNVAQRTEEGNVRPATWKKRWTRKTVEVYGKMRRQWLK